MTAMVETLGRVQEAADRFYVKQGPCCAGCDWWHHSSSVIGECRKSAPVSAKERYSVVRMDWTSWRLTESEAGHILTNRDHHCGDFKDSFEWTSLPPAYLRRIGWSAPNTQKT
jgi:hypothetical protein